VSGFEHDLAPGVTLLEVSIGFANFGQGINLSDRNLEAAGGEHASELRENLSACPCVVTVGLHTIFGCGLEVDDGVDPIRSNTQLESQLDVTTTEGINKGFDFACACSADPILNPITISNRDYAVIGEPLMIRIPGQADDPGARIAGQLDSDRAYPARGAGDDDSIPFVE